MFLSFTYTGGYVWKETYILELTSYHREVLNIAVYLKTYSLIHP